MEKEGSRKQVEDRYNKVLERLKGHSFRLTPQRMAVLRLLVFSENHPSVEEVYQQVRVQFPTTSIATVYKTIHVLKEIDEILELGFPDMCNRYDAARPYPHPHVVCIRCKKIIDPKLGGLGGLEEEVREKTGFEVFSHRIDFFGLCPECQAQEEQGDSKG